MYEDHEYKVDPLASSATRKVQVTGPGTVHPPHLSKKDIYLFFNFLILFSHGWKIDKV